MLKIHFKSVNKPLKNGDNCPHRILSNQILNMAQHVTQFGIKAKDALHVACAIAGQADYFLSTDDKLLKRLAALNLLTAMNPVDFIQVLEP